MQQETRAYWCSPGARLFFLGLSAASAVFAGYCVYVAINASKLAAQPADVYLALIAGTFCVASALGALVGRTGQCVLTDTEIANEVLGRRFKITALLSVESMTFGPKEIRGGHYWFLKLYMPSGKVRYYRTSDELFCEIVRDAIRLRHLCEK